MLIQVMIIATEFFFFLGGGVSVSGLWTFRIIEINKEKIIAEKNNLTNKLNFFFYKTFKKLLFCNSCLYRGKQLVTLTKEEKKTFLVSESGDACLFRQLTDSLNAVVRHVACLFS